MNLQNNSLLKIGCRWIKLPERKLLLRWGSWYFILINLLLTIIGLRYLVHYAWPKEGIAQFYTLAAFISHFAMMGYAPWLLLIFPLTLLAPIRKLILPLSVIIASVILTLLLLDSLVFAQNQFHINALTMSILGWKTWGFGIFYLIILLVFTSMLAKWSRQRFARPVKGGLGWYLAGILLTLLIATHVLHIWADAQYYVPITRFTTYLPLFYPSTAKRFMTKHGLVDLKQSREQHLMKWLKSEYQGALSYPLAPLRCDTPKELKNVLLIVVDAMRADIMTDKVAPNISAFADQGITFENHYSGGNSSRMGAFSLFYGLSSTYWKYFEGIQRTPLLIDKFQEHDYLLGIFSSGPLYRPTSLDRTVFAKVPNLRVKTQSEHNRTYERDAVITKEWTHWLDNREIERPFFGFLVYDSPGARDFPPNYMHIFKHPDGAPKVQQRFAKYKTAVHYADSLVGHILRDLQERKLLEETIVIITSDHGEEFDDNNLGYIGHGSNFNEYQLRTPLVIYWPGKQPAKVKKRTSHNDIPATLLSELFCCSNPPSDYCSGINLFSEDQWDWLIVGSYHNFAILELEQVTVSYPGGYFEIRDKRYRVISKRNLNRQVISLALNETKRFFKR